MTTQLYTHKLYIATKTNKGQTLHQKDCFKVIHSYMEFARFESYSTSVIEVKWNGYDETNIVVEVIGGLNCTPDLKVVAMKCKDDLSQDAILYTKQIVDCEFI